ncbi:trypsin-like peptidase domain-containing protein [Oscillatoria sp. FACHB-1407]|uniref:trypsin-like peptidase domain-containing protein n=1 Tax=Oscillatoria sp. FACHB-1407 TaxID=2692847 RepID=UPI0016868795|nr:trypsin-like peptidase domain-containing protein [Oscillatoria sp. FACHB-1407]MBD2464608.1 trypsin-like peptidase domain-containing protein [Oscillatoria sp. FACHB-1407]
MYKPLTALFVISLIFSPQIASANISQAEQDRRLAMRARPAVVRIVDVCFAEYKYNPDGSYTYTYDVSYGGMGTGFFINSDGYIATNAHVVQNSQEGRGECKDRLFDTFVERLQRNFGEDLGRGLSGDALRQHVEQRSSRPEPTQLNRVLLPNEGSLDFDVKSYGTPIDDVTDVVGKDAAIIKVSLENTPALELGDSGQVQILEPVIVIGYPSVADSFDTLDDESVFEASVTQGSVSAANKRTADNVPVLQLSAPVAPGSSGSPVLNSEGKVIGMVTFGNLDSPRSASSFGFAVRTETLNEFIGDAGTTATQGTVDSLYSKGLDLYWRGDYRRASIQFEQIRDLFKYHSEIDTLISNSQKAMAEGSNMNPLLWLVIVLMGGVIGALGFWLYRSKFALLQIAPQSTSAAIGRDTLVGGDIGANRGVSPSLGGFARRITTVFAPPAPAVQASITLKNAQGQSCQFSLTKARHQLGRDIVWADLQVPDEPSWKVFSGKHAIFQREGNTYRILDGDGVTPSTNGIFVDGIRIDPQRGHLLEDGQKLEISLDIDRQVLLYYTSSVSAKKL